MGVEFMYAFKSFMCVVYAFVNSSAPHLQSASEGQKSGSVGTDGCHTLIGSRLWNKVQEFTYSLSSGVLVTYSTKIGI